LTTGTETGGGKNNSSDRPERSWLDCPVQHVREKEEYPLGEGSASYSSRRRRPAFRRGRCSLQQPGNPRFPSASRASPLQGMINAGLDEAALGPRLGPFCAALVCVHNPETSAEGTNLYSLLDGVISRDGKRKELPAVGDSKILYTPSAGLSRLETGVCTFLRLAGLDLPTTLRSLVEALCPSEDLTAMDQAPWFAESSSLALPIEEKNLSTIARYARDIAARAGETGIVFNLPSARFITARMLNETIERLGGKGPAVREIISSLINCAFAAHDRTTGAAGSSPSSLRLTVDRQGGRRYYGEWLAELLPGEPIRAFEEGPTSSKYGVKKKRNRVHGGRRRFSYGSGPGVDDGEISSGIGDEGLQPLVGRSD
jgi:hypothetical protein